MEGSPLSVAEQGDDGYGPEAIKAKYLAERDRRLVPGRADIRDLTTDPDFRDYRADPFTPYIERQPVADDAEVVIVGGGIAGVVAGANLRRHGFEDIRIVDQAGGIGGTWYWNRYPGVMCDVESYIYMPMLEELGAIPTERYASGDEIRRHLQALAERFDLTADALFHTDVTQATWDEEAARWRIQTDRGDQLTARYYVLAVGILNLMKLPAVKGMETFAGRSFHTARWDYAYTGGGPGQPLTELGDQAVALIGTGASGIQVLAPLAAAARQVYVFQRTPSAIGVRGNRPTGRGFGDRLEPGWQLDRMDNFQAIMLGHVVDADLTDDGWTHDYAASHRPPWPEGMSPADYYRGIEETDFRIMEEHRARVAELVRDPATAEILKPYYRYLCKRPCFHDEYLQAFNEPNVTLVDCPAGIDEVDERGLVVDGQHYDVDLIIYGTGFEAELTPLPRRAGHEVIGRGGLTLADKWADGGATLFGMLSRGFPNLVVMPAPGQQAVVTVNYTQLAVLGGRFVGELLGGLRDRGVEVFDVSAEAEDSWVQGIVDAFVDGSSVMSACTPSRLNMEGDPKSMSPRSGNYGGGMGDWFAYRQLLEDWLATGDYDGLELDQRA